MRLFDRFKAFCRQYPRAEEIDKLVKCMDVPMGAKIADFLFADRTIVCEIKTLTTETAEKLAAFMSESGIDPSELTQGRHDVVELFLSLSDGEAKLKKAITIATTPVADGLDDAEKQIRDTKTLLGRGDADGLLVILNDLVELASPPLVKARLEQRIAKNGSDGTPYHANVNHVIFICEKYVLTADHTRACRRNAT